MEMDLKMSAATPVAAGGTERKLGTIVSRPIIYGSIATYLGRKAEETKTHRWYVYVRGLHNEDLSYMISKVVITLHQSFANPVREILEAPFEVSDVGWGEFETRIQIHFHDPSERPIDILHFLKLYPAGNQPVTTKKPVLHEYYDELVFKEPSQFFYKKLMDGPEKQAPVHPLQDCFPIYSEMKDLEQIQHAQEVISKELASYKERLLAADTESEQLRELIKAAQKSANTVGEQ